MPSKGLPQRTRTHVLGDLAVKKVTDCFPVEWVCKPNQGSDYGIDMVVEIVKGTNVSPASFEIQIKGTDTVQKEDMVKIKGVKTSTVRYWKGRVVRTMLAAYSSKKDVVVWRWVDDLPDPEPGQDKTTISIPMSQKLSEVDWKEFSAGLESRYGKMLEFFQQEVNKITTKTLPFLEGKSNYTEKQGMIDRECGLDIYNEATIVHYGGDKCGIIDCGRSSREDVMTWLKERHIRSLAFIAISHFHVDHYGALTTIMSAMDKIESIFIPPIDDMYFKAAKIQYPAQVTLLLGEIKRWGDTGTRVYQYGRTQKLLLGQSKSRDEINMEIYFPDEGLRKNSRVSRNNSLSLGFNYNEICPVFRISIGNSSFWIPGDATISVWREVLVREMHSLASNGLLLPHNGSQLSLDKGILKEIIKKGAFPAVYQPNHRFKLPRKEVLEFVVKQGGVLINVEKRPAQIRMRKDGLELQ